MTASPAGPDGFREEQARLRDAAADDEMFDMVNLPARRTGVEGVIHVSTAQGPQGPRVKWYPGRPGRDAACLVVTLETPPRAINQGLPARTARTAEPAVIEWATRNRDALLDFWRDGLGWDVDEVNAFVDGLAKVP